VSLENNGGFASVRSLPARQGLAGSDAFVVSVRGDGRSYKFTARTDPSLDSAIYQCSFTTKKDEWEEHRLPLKQFIPTFRGRVLSSEPPLDAARITSVGFLISDQQDAHFNWRWRGSRWRSQRANDRQAAQDRWREDLTLECYSLRRRRSPARK
jgi:NADH dehydrogenase [ubiquinone] 1 alpha subcomplex assembly factor 1